MPYIVFAFFFIIELSCLVFISSFENKALVSIVYVVVGVFIGLAALGAKENPQTKQRFQLDFGYLILLIILSILVLEHYASLRFSEIAIDYRTADMLPVIHVMCERLITSQEVYELIPEIWNGMQPIYLPAIWLPFIPAVLFDFDMRWVGLAGIVISFSIIMLLGRQSAVTNNRLDSFILLICVSFFISCMVIADSILISMTQEGVVIFYYVLLSYALYRRNVLLIGLSISLCMMSRFFLAPWLISYAVLLLLSGWKNELARIVVLASCLVFLLMFTTGAIHEINLFLSLPNMYTEAVLADPGKFKPIIEGSLGCAKFFSYEALAVLNSYSIILSILAPLALILWHRFVRSLGSDSYLALASLKIVIVITLNFLIIPFTYLFYISSFISLLLLSTCLSKKKVL